MDGSEIRLLAHHGQAQLSGRVSHEQRPAVFDQQHGEVGGISETQLAALKRQWAESHCALADRAMKDREEIERLTQLLYDQQKQSLRQLRARAEMSGISAPAAPAAQGERQNFGGEASCQTLPPHLSQAQQAPARLHQPGVNTRQPQSKGVSLPAIQAALAGAQPGDQLSLAKLQGQLAAEQRATRDHRDASKAARQRYQELARLKAQTQAATDAELRREAAARQLASLSASVQDGLQARPALSDAEDAPATRIRRRDDLIAQLTQERDAAVLRCQRVQQRVEDFFGPEAADVEPPRLNASGTAEGTKRQAPKTTREAQLLATVSALQRALHRAGRTAAGGVTNAKFMQAQGKIKSLTQQVTDLEASLKSASSDKAEMLRLAQKSTMMQAANTSLRRQLSEAQTKAGGAADLTAQTGHFPSGRDSQRAQGGE
ncbi:hypothetical protein WJX73_009130 [Symbiochloris irregularis]|uniref:Uncharacterized protein n=1 Tax=Symbiochloris irregularis TaxID=706552 RepID=A0AAW1PBM4_9CHLO